jgi:UPF0176 protein
MYDVLAFYVIREVSDVAASVKEHKDFLGRLDSKSRIYIGKDGINAQLSLAEGDTSAYVEWIKGHPIFYDADIKIHKSETHPFAKLKIKERKQLVAIDRDVDFNKRGEYLNAKEWSEKLSCRDEKTILIDVRNKYESMVGHFEGALVPDLETFREFPAYAEELKEQYNPKDTEVIMYCTGGIRCEYYSALMKEIGFEKVFHLKGGIIRYGLENGAKHWKGKLFVFDDRMNVPICSCETEILGKCHFCSKPNDTFYNCANMDCNELFLSCPECVEKMKGCCSDNCLEHGRVRSFEPVQNPKPFRKLSHVEKEALKK